MVQIPWRICGLLLPFLFSSVSGLQSTEERWDDPGLNNFVSRPDIRAPKWNLKIYHEDLIAPGYWFIGPYRILNQETFGSGWVGAHIYDGRGELIWSGAHMFSKGNIEDFRLSNVNGEYLMTLMDQGRAEAVIFDNHYEIREVVHLDHFNSHELNFVENGTRALIIKSDHTQATEEMSQAIGFDGRCGCAFDYFQELDVTNNWEPVFTFRSFGTIGLDESTLTEEQDLDRRCNGHWDYIHTNSVDKTSEGDYLYSARHADTIFKVSKEGNIVWRLGGTKSDFDLGEDVRFSRQHDVRFRENNGTHMIISILDNARGLDHTAPPSHENSRGLVMALDEKNMKASVVSQIQHPEGPGGYSPRRGNYQILPNGNIFMGWSEHGIQSEYTSDGTMVFESILAVDWLGTYRQYKFPFVGEPTDPPDVHAEAFGFGNGTTATVVHVSWNGATEVTTWNLYKTNSNGDVLVLLASSEKLSFETVLAHNTFASHVLVKGVDKHGKVLGSSGVFKTVVHKNVTEQAQDEEKQWLDDVSGGGNFFTKVGASLSNPIAAFFTGVVCSGVILLVGWYLRQRGAFRFIRATRYHKLRSTKEQPAYEPFSEEEQSLPLRHSKRESFDEGP